MTLGNTPRTETVMTLAARKSYAFGLRFLNSADESVVDLTGCTVRLVIKKQPRFGSTLVLDRDAVLLEPTLGTAQVAIQASELDQPAGEYAFSLTLVSALGYSTLLMKGVIDLQDNTESESTSSTYTNINPSTNLAVYLDGGDLVTIKVDAIDGMYAEVSKIFTDFQVVAENAIEEMTTVAGGAEASATAAAASAVAAAAAAELAEGVVTADIEGAIALVDANENSKFRQQQDARHLASTDARIAVARESRTVNIWDYGPTMDGVADDSAALAAAIADAGVGGKIELSKGVFGNARLRCDTPQTLLDYQTLEGSGQSVTRTAVPTVEIYFPALTGAQVGLTLGVGCTVRNLQVRGPGSSVGTTTGIKTTSVEATYDFVYLMNWAVGVAQTGTYYSTFTRCGWRSCGTGLSLTNCYNVTLVAPRFNCTSTDGTTLGTAIAAGNPRGLTIVGGSIENYVNAVTMLSAGHLTMTGVYFETEVDASAVAVSAASRDKVSITATGCFVYLNGHTEWINVKASTNTSLAASGNRFVCVDASTTTPTAYAITPGQDVDLAGDNWSEVTKAGCTYAGVSSGSLPGAGIRIAWPQGSGASLAGTTFDGRRPIRTTTSQTLASAGAVTFDSASGNQIVVLNANATSSTISNAINGTEMDITWQQDATGGRTYAWPTKCKFAGGTAPSDTTASTRTTVRFRYQSFYDRWHEVSRAVAVPVS